MTESCIRQYADESQIKACRENIKVLDNRISQLTRILNLAGNEVRYKILYLLNTENKLCVCDMSDILEMKVSPISQHLRKLKDAGIINSLKEGQTVFYYIEDEHNPIIQTLFSLLNADNLQEV